MGSDVRASDGLPLDRLESTGSGSVERELRDQAPRSDDTQTPGPLPTPTLAARNPDSTGNRSSARWRDEASRLREGCRRAEGADGARHGANQKPRRAVPSDFRQDVRHGMATVGIPSHGSSPSPVQRLGSSLARAGIIPQLTRVPVPRSRSPPRSRNALRACVHPAFAAARIS